MQQLTITDAANDLKLQLQSECSHDFIIIPHFDYEHDRIYEQLVCSKCGYVKD
ncbi:MAG: hypothetical protein WC412_02130 [Candidatus Omnitrophota bacterium]|jgi:hypothetical protein